MAGRESFPLEVSTDGLFDDGSDLPGPNFCEQLIGVMPVISGPGGVLYWNIEAN